MEHRNGKRPAAVGTAVRPRNCARGLRRNFDTGTFAHNQASVAPCDARLRRLAGRLHSLGERPLYEFLRELARGAEPWAALEAYGRLAPLATFIATHDGDRLPPVARLVRGCP